MTTIASNDDDDDDRTVPNLESEFASSSSMSVHTLPEGTRIRDYRITGLIGEGGFGIVYLAYDLSLQRRVAIKEYLPSSMASRASGSMDVVVKSPHHAETFALGLKSFLNEARLLARFDHPSLVKVYRFWEENGTAYMVMPYYEGPTLKRALAELGHPPDEAALRNWLRPLLDALALMHEAHCFHRDIAPDNILLTPIGPLLLDFGAARRVIGDMTHALTIVLKPGFAPIEQYGESASMKQGAWTDLYALASVVYAAVTGHAPMPSVERLMDDRLKPLSELAAGRYSEPFLAAIDAALALRPKDRPQTVDAFRALLEGRGSSAEPAIGFASTFDGPLDSGLPEAEVPPSPPRAVPVPASDERQQRRTLLYVLGGAAGLLGLAAAGYFLSDERRVETVRGPATAPSVSEAASVPASTPAPAQKVAIPEPAHVVPEPVTAAQPAPTIATTPSTPTTSATDASVPAITTEPASAATATTAITAPTIANRARPHPEPRSPEPRPAPPVPATRPLAERPAPTNAAVTRAKCSDILQKGSLEPLSASETDFLKKECR